MTGPWKLRRTGRSDTPEGIIALLAVRPHRLALATSPADCRDIAPYKRSVSWGILVSCLRDVPMVSEVGQQPDALEATGRHYVEAKVPVELGRTHGSAAKAR